MKAAASHPFAKVINPTKRTAAIELLVMQRVQALDYFYKILLLGNGKPPANSRAPSDGFIGAAAPGSAATAAGEAPKLLWMGSVVLTPEDITSYFTPREGFDDEFEDSARSTEPGTASPAPEASNDDDDLMPWLEGDTEKQSVHAEVSSSIVYWHFLGFGLANLLAHPALVTGASIAHTSMELLLEIDHATATSSSKRSAAAKQLKQLREVLGVTAMRPSLTAEPASAPVITNVSNAVLNAKNGSSGAGRAGPESPRPGAAVPTLVQYSAAIPPIYAFHCAPSIRFPLSFLQVVPAMLKTLSIVYRKLLDFDIAQDDEAYVALLRCDVRFQETVIDVIAQQIEKCAQVKMSKMMRAAGRRSFHGATAAVGT